MRPERASPVAVIAVIAVGSLICLAAACGGSSKPASNPNASPTSAASAIPAGTVLNVGDQQQYLQTLLKASGFLSGASYQVNFVEFDSGPLVDAGFAAHRIDIGFTGDLPAALAVKSGLPVTAVAAFLPIGASEYLLAKPGITSIAELRGQPVAYTTGTAEQAFALRALATAGLTQRDIRQVNVTIAQLGTVLESGSVDASVVSVEQKIDYQRNHPGATVLATLASVQPPSYYYILGSDAALASPAKQAAIADFTRRMIEANLWVKAHKTEFLNDYYVDLLHERPAVAQVILAAGGTYTFEPITAGVEADLQDVVGLEVGAGVIPHPFSVAPLYNPAATARYNGILQSLTGRG